MKYYKRYIPHLGFTFDLVSFLSNVKQMEFMQNSSFWIWHVPFYFRDLYQYQVAFRWQLIDGMYNEWWFAFSNQIITYVKTCDDQICFKLFFEFLHRTIIFKLFILPKKSGFSAAAVFINQFAHIPTFFDMYHLVRRDFRWFYFRYIRKYSADFYHMPILICLLIKTICGTRIKEIFF